METKAYHYKTCFQLFNIQKFLLQNWYYMLRFFSGRVYFAFLASVYYTLYIYYMYTLSIDHKYQIKFTKW